MESDYRVFFQIGRFFLAKTLDHFCPYTYFLGQASDYGYRILWTIGRKHV